MGDPLREGIPRYPLRVDEQIQYDARHGQHLHKLVQGGGFIGDAEGGAALEKCTGFSDDGVQHGCVLLNAEKRPDGLVDLVPPKV